MHYFDASYLIPLVRRERSSEQIRSYIKSIPNDLLVTSHWAKVECRSGLALEVRTGRTTQTEFADYCLKLEELLPSFHLVSHSTVDYKRAWDLLERPERGLRAGDALHLAIAERLGVDLLLSLDRKLIQIGAAIGVAAGVGFGEAG